MQHTVLTFVTKVNPARVGELQRVLDEIAADVTGNRHVPFGALTRLHFASLAVLPDDGYGPTLVFENNFDGPLGPHLREMVERAADGLDRIYRCCVGYHARGPDDRAAIATYLRAHVVRPGAYHVGNVGRSLDRVRREAKLRDEIETCLDRFVQAGQVGASPRAIRGQIQDFVDGDPKWDWAREAAPRRTLVERAIPWARVGVAGIGALGMLPVLAVIGPIWWFRLLRQEKRDSVWSGLADHDHVQRLLDVEDRRRVIQIHMVNVSPVKPGRLRQATIRLVLGVANLLTRFSTNGTLSNIPSIHFAHWSLIDGGRRLLFLSNYDGSWENYLDDFIDKASNGLTAIWGNTVDFPRVRGLVGGGSRDGPNFKQIARARQVPTPVWYSAYPDLTVEQINKNSTIREQLFAPLDDKAERAYLRSF